MLASRNGQTEIVKLLIANGANVQARDNAALIHAAIDGEDEIVKLLIANRADVQADDNYALRVAAENGHYEIVKLLIANGADVQLMIIMHYDTLQKMGTMKLSNC